MEDEKRIKNTKKKRQNSQKCQGGPREWLPDTKNNSKEDEEEPQNLIHQKWSKRQKQHYSWIACQLEVGTSFYNRVRLQFRDYFWIPEPKLHGAKYLFFVKPKNGPV